MTFTLPRKLLEAEKVALVLSYGRLSVLEACTVLKGSATKAESPSERVSVIWFKGRSQEGLLKLAGIHKCGPLIGAAPLGVVPDSIVNVLEEHLVENSNLSLSGYGVSDDEYEVVVRSVLDRARSAGLKKVRLLRPAGNELKASDVISRSSLDIVVFPYGQGLAYAPTVWVTDSRQMRREFTRPVPHPEISLSPRLARVLLNLAGLERGQTVVDPFCGAGTILTEAYFQSYSCLGFDIEQRRVDEARKNLRSAAGGVEGRYDVRRGDARQLRRVLRSDQVDAFVTEPLLLPAFKARPSFQTASRMVEDAAHVYAAALSSMAQCLAVGGRIVVVVPIITTLEDEEVALSLEGRKLGLKLHQPGPVGFDYPARLSFESTRWVKRGVYVFESY